MTTTHEAVKTRHKETTLIFPVLALAVLLFWGSSQSLPAIVGINVLALVGILASAFSVVRHADVLAHRLGEPFGSLILSLSVVILEVSLISALMATGDAAPTLMRDTLYSIIMIVTGGLVGFSLLLGGRKFATQYVNLFGIKQYLIALFPLAIIVLVFPMALPEANFTTGQALLVALISAAMYGVFLLIQTKTHQSLFVYEHEDDGDDDDPHHGKPSAHGNLWHTAWLIVHLIAVIAVTKMNAQPLEALLTEVNAPVAFTGFLVALLIAGGVKSGAEQSGAARDESLFRFGAGDYLADRTGGDADCLAHRQSAGVRPRGAGDDCDGGVTDALPDLLLDRAHQCA